MKVKYTKPHHGNVVGSVAEYRVGICRTLIALGVAVEIEDEPKLDADKDVKPKRPSSKSSRSKKSSKD